MKYFPGYLFILFFISSNAQTALSTDFYAFDANWKPTAARESPYFIAVTLSDSGFEWAYYNNLGPIVRSEMHSTHDGPELRGPFFIYNSTGDLDSMGSVNNGKRTGDFFTYGAASDGERVAVTKYAYVDDSLIEVKDLRAGAEDWIRKQKAGTSAAKNIPLSTGQNGVYDPGNAVPLPIDSSIFRDAYFPGGMKGWQFFLQHNLRYPDGAVARELTGRIIIRFFIDENGKTSQFFVLHSANFWMDQEALRVVKKSGDWIPAYDHGTPVGSYKSLPLAFLLEQH